MNHCCICKKPLTNFTSVKIGMGPVCRAHHGKGQKELFDDHAVFRIEEDADSYVYIVDWGNHQNCKTVTNDVEWVLSELNDLIEGFENKRLFYMDSEQRIDEIVHSGKTFISFKAGHEGVKL